MLNGLEIRTLKRMPQWMHDPQNRRVALETLRRVKPHRAYVEIAKALSTERQLRVKAIEINTFAFSNRGENERGPEWLRKYLAQSLGEVDTQPIHSLTEKKEAKTRKPRKESTRAKSRAQKPAETDAEAAVSRANKQAKLVQQEAEVTRALATNERGGVKAELEEECARILRGIAWGRPEMPRNVEISYARMSVQEKVGKESIITMVPGVRITINVSVSSASRGPLSEEARRGFALAQVIKKALETGKLGTHNATAPLLGYGRVDFFLKAKGKTTLLTKKIIPLDALALSENKS